MDDASLNKRVRLSDKYVLDEGKAYMTGVQALVRLPIVIRRHDRLRGLNTAGFISGYRGSPLGNYDMQLAEAKAYLEPENIVFQPGINEDLGATAVWGSQQVNLFEGARYDGVFGIWYGKGPGVDRCGDVFKHANFAGTSALGGVLALAGDDHSCKSSTLPNQSEYAFWDAEMPTVAPATIEEVLIFGVKAIQMSRFSGCWIGMKTISDLMDAAMSVPVAPDRRVTHIPDIALSPDGMNIRLSDNPEAKEYRHRHYKLPAAQAFARLNGFDRVVYDGGAKPRFGVIASGKAYLHVLDALRLLGISESKAEAMGLKFLKIGLVWPLDPFTVKAFSAGLESILVVEERRPLIEPQLRDALYDLKQGQRPVILGKRDHNNQPLLADVFDLDTVSVALALAKLWGEAVMDADTRSKIERLKGLSSTKSELVPLHVRKPFFCSGCPHNSSTQLPEGSRATAGIGCHYMATFMPGRKAETCTHMGGEGVPWIGQAPFTEEKHIFANLGDGTYFHSGLLAIRASVAAKVNITYKILFNDAVAMTGGQAVDGVLTPVSIARQVSAEGIETIYLVSPDPDRWRDLGMPEGVKFEHRDDLESVQKTLRDTKGCSVIIYDQVCATELRRRRKRGLADQPSGRIFINPAVCEGCGDCSVKSNCIAVGPLETELGRKRVIDQSACNVDKSCVKGFCPSFVELEGATVRPQSGMNVDQWISDLPDTVMASLDNAPFNLLLTGIGGLGVTSISGIIGMAAHIDQCEVMSIDQTGLAQRGGAVDSHIRISPKGHMIPGGRIPYGEVDLLLAADMVTAHSKSGLPLLDKDRTTAFLNGHLTPTAEFTLNTATQFNKDGMLERIKAAVKSASQSDYSLLSVTLFGDSLFAFMIMLGHAWQEGCLPISLVAFEEAIKLNGAAVATNQKAFKIGRALSLGRLPDFNAPKLDIYDHEAFKARRIADLIAYQDQAYSDRYRRLLEMVEAKEAELGVSGLSETVARYLYKLMAYKDEYEVARLQTLPAFKAALQEQFQGTAMVRYHLSPPLIAPKDKATGLPRKVAFGPWMGTAFTILKKFKFLRGTPLDLFGYTSERQMERGLITQYETLIHEVLVVLSRSNHAAAMALLAYPDMIKGFGYVKHANWEKAMQALLALKANYFSKPEKSSSPSQGGSENNNTQPKEVSHV